MRATLEALGKKRADIEAQLADLDELMEFGKQASDRVTVMLAQLDARHRVLEKALDDVRSDIDNYGSTGPM